MHVIYHSRGKEKASNAWHHPRPHSTCMRDFVMGVGCMPLLCCAAGYGTSVLIDHSSGWFRDSATPIRAERSTCTSTLFPLPKSPIPDLNFITSRFPCCPTRHDIMPLRSCPCLASRITICSGRMTSRNRELPSRITMPQHEARPPRFSTSRAIPAGVGGMRLGWDLPEAGAKAATRHKRSEMSFVITFQLRRSGITPRITRRAAPMIRMTACVSAVGCMRLFGGDATSRPRGACHPHGLRLPPTTRELHHAPLARRDWFLPRGNRPANLLLQ
jgi:hypothetical protein